MDSVPGTAWRVFEVKPREWWATDRAGTALRVESGAAELLWSRAHALSRHPLPRALALARSSSNDPVFVDLRLLDVTTRYVSDDPGVVEALRAWFGAAVPVLRESPAVIVSVDRSANLDRIYRTVDQPRDGVRIGPCGDELLEARADLPAFPPLQAPPFAGRLTGVHACLVDLGRRALMVCGARRMGKTTFSQVAAKLLGVSSVLADELTLLDESTMACGVPLPIRERTPEGRTARPLLPSPRIGQRLEVGHVVVLGSDERPGARRVDDVQDALRLLAPHVRAVSDEASRSTVSLLGLVRKATVWEWRVRRWPELADDLSVCLGDLLPVAAGDD